ncbi:MAG: hypothetical protein ACLFOY_10260 [Desulfatibacillaceae bacterium]
MSRVRVAPVVAAMVVLLCIGVAGCGLKAPPAAPRSGAPGEVERVVATVRKGGVEVVWEAPRRGVRPEKYVVLRNAERLGEPGCDGCPIRYEPVATVLADTAGPDGLYTYMDSSTKPGYRYRYTISATAPGGPAGGRPKPAMVEYDLEN